jgi:peptide-methionine (S)-S-oxide reductase
MFSDKLVVMPIISQTEFFPIKGAESCHQDFYKNNPTRYKTYRWGCGRDQRLSSIWGDKVTH